MASPADGAVTPPAGGNIFDQMHAQATQQQPAAASPAVPAAPTPNITGISAGSGTDGMSGQGFLDNLADSTGRFVSSLPSAAGLLKGIGEKASRLMVPGQDPAKSDDEQNADRLTNLITQHPMDVAHGVGKYVIDRYGGWDKAKMTAYRDPVGFAADLSTVLGGGATALKVAGKVGTFAKLSRTAEILGDLGSAASKASDLTNPLNIPGNLATAVGGKTMTKAARSIYQGALKPPVTNGAAENAAITEMGLKERIPLNGKAAQAGKDLAAAKQAPTKAAIAGSTAQIDPNDVAALATAKFRPGLSNAANPGSGPATFDANIEDYLQKHTPPPGPPLASPQPYPIQDAQVEKIATYDKAANSYGKDAGVSPEQTATKALGYGLKTAMEQFIPELKGLNETEATAIGLKSALAKFAAREGNTGKLMQYLKPSVASSLAAGGAAYAEHSIPAAIGAHLLTKALEDPAIQSRIAIALHKAANNPGTPYFRRIMTPAQRIADVQDHVNDVEDKHVAPPAAAPAKSTTAAHIQGYATAKGIPLAQAQQEFAASGYTVEP